MHSLHSFLFRLFVVAGPSSIFFLLYVSYRRAISFKIADVIARIQDSAGPHGERLNDLAALKYKGYVVPVLFSTLICATGALVALSKATPFPCAGGTLGQDCPWYVLSAFAGAYTSSVFDLVRRQRRIEMHADSVHRAWHRMLSAPIIAAVLAPTFAES